MIFKDVEAISMWGHPTAGHVSEELWKTEVLLEVWRPTKIALVFEKGKMASPPHLLQITKLGELDS